MNQLVSVIVPAYNLENRIGRTISSLLAQDHDELEIIIVDDASADSTAAVAEAALSGTGKGYVHRKRYNGGVSAARNTGLQLAKGEYVIFFDGDDLAEPNYVSSLYATIARADADVAFCAFKFYYERSGEYKTISIRAVRQDKMGPEEVICALITSKLVIPIGGLIIKKALLFAAGLRFSETSGNGEDIEFSKKVFVRSAKAAFISEALYIYVRHDDQITATPRDSTKGIKLRMESFGSWFRSAAYLLRYAKTEKLKNITRYYFLPEYYIKRMTYYAKAGDRRRFDSMGSHRKIRGIMLSSVRALCIKPEVFLKAAAIVLCPDLYFRLRNKNSKGLLQGNG